MIWIKDQQGFNNARSRMRGCYLCGDSPRDGLQKDHIVPKSMLRPFNPNWLPTLPICADCHNRKNQVEQNAIRLHKTITESKPMPLRERFPVRLAPQKLIIPGASDQALTNVDYFHKAASYWARGWMALLYARQFPDVNEPPSRLLSPFIEWRGKGEIAAAIAAAEELRRRVHNILFEAHQRHTVDCVELSDEVASFWCTWIREDDQIAYCVWALFVPHVEKYRDFVLHVEKYGDELRFEPSPFVGCVQSDCIPQGASITQGPCPKVFR